MKQPVDQEAERARLRRKGRSWSMPWRRSKPNSTNQEFMDRAPREVVRGVEHRHTELSDHYQKVVKSLERLN